MLEINERISLDDVVCDKMEAQDYVDVLNGIVHDCGHGGFACGLRNQVAVDLTVCCHMLDLDPLFVLNYLIQEGVIDPSKDDEDTVERVERVMCYDSNFSWDYMINPEMYVKFAKENEGLIKPVEFFVSVVSD